MSAKGSDVTSAERRARGIETYASQFGINSSEVEAYFFSTFGGVFAEEAFQATGGGAWHSGPLDLKTRGLIVIGILSSLGGVEPRLRGHVLWALENGATPEEIEIAVLLVANYAGFARASIALEVAREVIQAALSQKE